MKKPVVVCTERAWKLPCRKAWPTPKFRDEEGGDGDASDCSGADEEEKIGDVNAEEFKAENMKKEGKVDASDDHEGDDDPFGRCAIVAGDTVIAH